MPGRPSPKPTTFFRKLERVFIGFLMTIMAFVLEKIVMRGIRKEGGKGNGASAEATSITTKGGEIDFEPEL